jgi:hypothetical protein
MQTNSQVNCSVSVTYRARTKVNTTQPRSRLVGKLLFVHSCSDHSVKPECRGEINSLRILLLRPLLFATMLFEEVRIAGMLLKPPTKLYGSSDIAYE